MVLATAHITLCPADSRSGAIQRLLAGLAAPSRRTPASGP